jgi:hypothetical protein
MRAMLLDSSGLGARAVSGCGIRESAALADNRTSFLVARKLRAQLSWKKK